MTATKLDQSLSAQIALQATDISGNSAACDPYFVTLGRGSGNPGSDVSHRVVVQHVARGESKLTIYNETPGLRHIALVVDGKRMEVKHLKDGEQRVIDLSRFMRRGYNAIVLEALGKPAGKALVPISE